MSDTGNQPDGRPAGRSIDRSIDRSDVSGHRPEPLRNHATFVERVWFEEAFTGEPRSVLGIEAGPDESYQLDDSDTIESVRAAYIAACENSRAAMMI